MSVRRPFACLTLFAVAIASFAPSAEAGPLLDWLFGYRTAARPAYPVGPPVPVGNAANAPVGYAANMPATRYPVGGYVPAAAYAPSYAANYGNYYGSMMPVIGPSGYGYPAAQPSGVAAATAPSIMSYVPDYRTSQYRAPVTYYRPLITTDPNTGSQVVALAPCTSYEYQTQRIPTFGYNGVMGSYSTPPVVPPPPTMPTYTLPSGGIPLAAGGPAAVLPPTSGSYAMGYGGYSNLNPMNSPAYSSNYGSPYSSYSLQQSSLPQQPSVLTAPPSGNYPTQPLSSTPGYYGSVSGGSTGGSTGNYATPGLVAPPGYHHPVNPAPFNPSQNYQPLPSTPSTVPFRDPAGDAPPVLAPINTGANLERPQLRAIVRQPLTSNNSLNSEKAPLPETRPSQGPTMDPIPVPADFDKQPRWNPGLINDQDRTALRPVAPNSHTYAGQSKAIQWASFKSESKPTAVKQSNGLRPVAAPPSAFNAPVRNSAPQNSDDLPLTAPRPARQRSTGGWKAVK